MVVLDLALGILSNFMYDSATKNTQSDCLYSIYDKSIKQLTKKYNKLEEYHIETFLHEDNVQKAINNYLKHLNQNETFSILKTEFFKLLNKSYFTEDDAELILNDFFQILNEAIEQDDQLREYLKLYLLKDTHNDLKDMKEMLKASSEGPGNINYDAHIENYLNQILDGKLFLNTSIFYTELSLLEISVKDIFPLTLKTENENKTEEFEISDVVEKESKIIISGESGSGKTTTLRWLTYTYAKKCLEENNPYIPFYVELNNYVEGTFLDYIITCAKEYGLAEEATKMLFEDKIKDKNVILLIDGLDLLTDTNEFIPYTYISNFITGHPSFRYIISSRPGFIDRFNKKEFKIFEIHELTEDKMKSFIDRYLGDQKEISEIIINEILSNKNVSMFKNPLMLFFAINIAFSRLEEETILPSTRTKLYEYFIENLLSHYKEKGKKLNSDWLQIEGVANNLYFVIQSQNLIRYERKYALKIAEKKSKEIAEEYGLHTVRGLDVLDDLFSLGLFNKEREYVTYGFHQSFQEYFSAAKLKELFENGTDISSAFNHPKWENVVIFISEMIENPDLLVESIIENGELNLASKCAKNTSIELKKKLCTLLSNKMGSRFIVEKMNATNSLGMLGICDDLLIEALRDDDKYVRQSASEVLGEIKSERAVEPLIEALRDDDKYVRQSAIRALIEIKSEKAVELLFYVLKDKNLIVKVGATVALGEIKSDKMIEPLIEALRDKDVRWSAAKVLGKIKSEKVIEPLINTLRDEDKDVRQSVVEVLGEIKSEKAVELLINTLRDENKDVRQSAAKVLGKIKSEEVIEPLINTLRDEDRFVRESAAETLGEIKSERAVEPLIEALRGEDENVRRSAAYSLGEIKSERAVEPLIEALRDEDKYFRRSAAYSLGKIKSERAVELLIEALRGEDENVRWGAAMSLGEIKSERAVEPLIEALRDEDKYVRESAAKSLGEIKSERAVEPLINTLRYEDGGVQLIAAEALGKIKSDKAVEPLIEALRGEDENVRWGAAKSLGEIKSEMAVEPLIKELRDEASSARWRAAMSLGEIKSEKAIGSLIETLSDKDSFARKRAVEALSKIKSEKAVEPLIKTLRDEDRFVRESAAKFLGEIKSERAIEPLIKTLRDEDEYVRQSAAEALSNICTVKDKEILGLLQESKDNFVANKSFDILKEIERTEAGKSKLFQDIIQVT